MEKSIDLEEMYCPLELAEDLERKGFGDDWKGGSIRKYLEGVEGYRLPTIQVVLEWFRTRHDLEMSVTPAFGEYETFPGGGFFEDTLEGWQLTIYDLKGCRVKYSRGNSYYMTHLSGCMTGIRYCLENLV